MGHYVPHTDAEIAAMLKFLGLGSRDDLYAHIPDAVRLAGGLDVAPGAAESDVLGEVNALAGANRPAVGGLVSFAGFGASEHDVPAVVPSLTLRSEFVTSYTPYQPELSPAVLQALVEE